jgi:hypothetical protein
MRSLGLVASAAIAILALPALPAQAGLIGAGNSVQALFHFNTDPATQMTIGEPETNPPTPTSLSAPVTIPEGTEDGSSIGFSASEITITNLLPGTPFCSTPTAPCASEFWAFEFQFTGAIDITSATIDPATAADFQPTGTGLQLLSSTDVEVEVTGDSPAMNDPLILDLTFASTTPPPTVPEPMSVLLLGSGLLALSFLRRRARR